MNAIVIDWNEVIMLIIGAFIGIGSSIAMMFIQNVNEKFGKMCIYLKFNCLKNRRLKCRSPAKNRISINTLGGNDIVDIIYSYKRLGSVLRYLIC